MCDQQGDLMNGEGTLSCYNGCTGNIVSPMSYICTDYSIDENWSTGQRVVEYSFPTTADNVFVFRYVSISIKVDRPLFNITRLLGHQ